MNSNYFRKIWVLGAALLFALNAWAQTGIIRGKVVDGTSGEPMIGATVRVFQDSTLKGGAYTDLEGSYTVANLQPGVYRLMLTYVSYKTIEIPGVEIKAGETFSREVVMNPDIEDEGEKNTVVLTAKVENNTENRLLVIQRKSTNVMDGISSQTLRRTGDSDAGSAMKRVVGLTVEGGKYVYVRGLGDRYNKGFLNGAQIPGLDPDRNSVQMDMFPTTLIDNIMVYKTFTPDLPGDFTGGLVDIATRDFPESFNFRISSSLGYNTQASLRNDFLSGNQGKLDWLGIDDGTRIMPANIRNGKVPSLTFSDPDQAQALDEASKSFGTDMYTGTRNSFLNQNHSVSVGNQWLIKGKQPFGFIANLSYRTQEQFYNDGREARYSATDSLSSDATLNTQRDLAATFGSSEVLWGGLVKLSYKPSENHKISLNYLRNQSGTSTARYLLGPIPEDDPNLIFETRTIGWTQRAVNVFQASGDHYFPENKNLRVDWIGSYSISSQVEPDLRFFSNDFTVNGADTLYDLQSNLYNNPARFFRDMEESNADFRLNFSLPFKNWNGEDSKFKTGGAYTYRNRFFRERRIQFRDVSGNLNYNGSENEYWSEQNLGIISVDTTATGLQYNWGNIAEEATETANNYDGTQHIAAVYAMTELPITAKLKSIVGARYEGTFIDVASQDRNLPAGEIAKHDILPSVNLIYNPVDRMNLRASYTRTIARPTFRELAPYASFMFVGDYVLVGNENLERTLVDNIDFRWEIFPGINEIFSISGFYKHFSKPIETVINPVAANTELNFRNVDEAQLFGLEIEFRKKLSFLTDDLRVGGNLTLIKSMLDIAPDELALIRSLDPDASSTRPMFGQSPYTANADITYQNDSLGLSTSLVFNVFGPRIAAVSRGGTPNVYEQPRPTLDFSLSKNIGTHWALTARAKNLINPRIIRSHPLNGEQYIFSEFRTGRTFSLGISYRIE